MVVLPPGTLLQLMYLRERLDRLQPGYFIEVGPGSGEITDLLLQLGWRGTTLDLNPATVEALQSRFRERIQSGQLVVLEKDFTVFDCLGSKANLIISSMVMEHMEDEQESLFVKKARECLLPSGIMIGLVPGSPKHWGIEDEIAGHIRRYTRESLGQLMKKNGWRMSHSAGLTYPVSNILLPLSNFLVKRTETNKLSMTNLERTKMSGRRNVAYKTHFPPILGLLLNRWTMIPFHYLQKAMKLSSRALVLYFEATPLNIQDET